MTIKNDSLVPAKLLENSLTAQYTASNCRATITNFTVTNVGATIETISVHIVESGGSASNANLIIDARPIAVGNTVTLYDLSGQEMRPSSFVVAGASAANSLTIRINGMERT